MTARPPIPHRTGRDGARSRSTGPSDSVCVVIGPRFRRGGHRSDMPPTGPIRASADPTPHGLRRRTGRGAQRRGIAYTSQITPCGSRITAPRDSSCVMSVPRFRRTGPAGPTLHGLRRRAAEVHRAVEQRMRHDCAKVPSTGHIRAGTDPAPPEMQQRAGRGAQGRGTAPAS